MSSLKPLALALVLASTALAEPIAIGSQRELFIDAYLIDTMDGTALQLHPPTARGPVLQFDRPWEGHYSGYATILNDDGHYLLYYRGMHEARADGSNIEVTCVAESDDGIAFTRPELQHFEVMGEATNNVVLADHAPFSHNFAPFVDTRPEVPADERFKALAGTKKTGLHAFASEDGFDWRMLSDEPVITDGDFDSQNIAFWSEAEGQYVSYFRVFLDGVRAIARTTSPDFIHWSPRVDMTYGDTPREHLYTNQTAPYFRAPQIYVAVAARFMPGRRVISTEEMESLGGIGQYSGDCSDAVLLTSRGGSAYDRTFMEAFIRPGLGLNNWTSRTNYPAYGIVQTGPDEMSMYVQRNYGQDTHHLERLSMRLDGFASVNAPYEGGTITTKPFTFEGDALRLNYATSAAGSIQVEVQDEAGTVIPGFAAADCNLLIGDRIAGAVTWKDGAELSTLAGTPVRLHFLMKDADVYAMQLTSN